MPVVPYSFIGGLATDGSYIDATSRNWYRVDDLDEQQVFLNNMDASFYRLLEILNRRDADASQPKFQWFRNDVPQIETRINYASGYSSSDTTITVDDATVATPNMVALVKRTEELIKITSIASTSSLEIERGYANTPAAALVDDDELICLIPALSEKGTANLANGKLPVYDWNYVGFFSIKAQVTELQNATEMRYNIDFPTQVQEKYFQLRREINNALLWSKRHVEEDAVNGRTYHFNGVMRQVKTNVLDLSRTDGLLTWPMWNDFIHNTGSPNTSSAMKICVCGPKLYEAVNQMSYNKTVRSEYDEVLGTQVMRVESTQGITVDYVLDRFSFAGQHAGMGLLVDPNTIALRRMREFPIKVRPEIQDNDAHIREDEIYGSESIRIDNEELCGVIRDCEGPY